MQEPVEFSRSGEWKEGAGDSEIEGGGDHEGEAIQGIEAGECGSCRLDQRAQGGNCQVWIGGWEMLRSGAEVSSDGGILQGERTVINSIGAGVKCSQVRLPSQAGRDQ